MGDAQHRKKGTKIEGSAMQVIHTVGGIAERLGGPSRTVTKLCSSIGDLGCNVELVAGVEPSDADALIRPDTDKVRLRLVAARKMAGLKVYPGFSRAVTGLLREQTTPALVHDHGIWGPTNVAAWWAARRRRLPYVLSPRGMLEPWALGFKARKKQIAWQLYQKRIVESAAVVVATSEEECQSIKRLFPRLPVAIIPNGVDVPANAPVRPLEPSVDKRRIALFMSRIHPKKNVPGLLQAWRALAREVADEWRLVIAGPDEAGHGRMIQALVQELGLQDSVELIGPVSEEAKAAIFRSAEVFVLPSFSENFGVVVAEALAYGLPVIATTGTPWKELPRRGCGWWVGPDPESLASALTAATSASFEERLAMGAVGRAYAQEKFSWDGIGSSTVALYEWVLNKGAPRPEFVY